jgi:hypothetical protein
MTVKELIKILKKGVTDHDRAEIEWWVGDKQVELERIGQFGIIPDVTFTFSPYEAPMFKPIKHFRTDKEEIVKKTFNKIKKQIKNK